MTIDTLEPIALGDTTQWIRTRGVDASNPVLLLIQQGPGLPMINEVRRFERELRLEQAFTVVYWDQRGCGRSLRGHGGQTPISLKLMVTDTEMLLELLRGRFGKKVYVAGFSFGATIGAYASARRPDLVEALIAVGTDVDGGAAANSAYDFALSSARGLGNRRAVRQLEAIGSPPHLSARQFSTRVRWASNFGGVTGNETYATVVRGLLSSLLRSSDYSIADVVRTVRGVGTTQAALLAELASLDLVGSLPCLDVPIVMVQGRHDQVAPGEAAQRFHASLKAPYKELIWFEHSAHTPQFEEPEKFRDVLLGVRSAQRASTPTSVMPDIEIGVQS